MTSENRPVPTDTKETLEDRIAKLQKEIDERVALREKLKAGESK